MFLGSPPLRSASTPSHASTQTRRTNTNTNTVAARVAKKGDASQSEPVFTSPPDLEALNSPKEHGSAPAATATKSSASSATKKPSQNINIIPIGRWADGIPSAMGGHYLPSGSLAPLSNSKGPGIDIEPLYFDYPSSEVDTRVLVYDTPYAAAGGLAEEVAGASKAAIAAKGSFTIALSGGSLVKSLNALVARTDVDFSKWYVLFSDERVVSLSSADSNYKAAADEFLSKVPIPSSQILKIKEGLTASQTAEHYAGQMLDLSEEILPRFGAEKLPVLDMVLLGVGPDGHVASLFPNRNETAACADAGWVIPVVDSPKPPSARITLTMPVINAAKKVVVCALGEGKAEVVQRALEVQSLPGALPVQLVRPQEGLVWMLDTKSAQALSTGTWEDKKAYPRSEFAS